MFNSKLFAILIYTITMKDLTLKQILNETYLQFNFITHNFPFIHKDLTEYELLAIFGYLIVDRLGTDGCSFLHLKLYNTKQSNAQFSLKEEF